MVQGCLTSEEVEPFLTHTKVSPVPKLCARALNWLRGTLSNAHEHAVARMRFEGPFSLPGHSQ